MAKVTLNFSDVKFHIKEFQKVYILEGCSLVFYEPHHLKTRDKAKYLKWQSDLRSLRHYTSTLKETQC